MWLQPQISTSGELGPRAETARFNHLRWYTTHFFKPVVTFVHKSLLLSPKRDHARPDVPSVSASISLPPPSSPSSPPRFLSPEELPTATMNDPGLDEPIRDASNIVKENVEDPLCKFHGRQDDSLSHSHNPAADDSMDEEEQERNFLMPARWWYASTAIPLVAGTFGPMANAFSICALVENWRVEIPEGGTEEHGIDIKDPPWYVKQDSRNKREVLVDSRPGY